jgi:hypothetical protein
MASNNPQQVQILLTPNSASFSVTSSMSVNTTRLAQLRNNLESIIESLVTVDQPLQTSSEEWKALHFHLVEKGGCAKNSSAPTNPSAIIPFSVGRMCSLSAAELQKTFFSLSELKQEELNYTLMISDGYGLIQDISAHILSKISTPSVLTETKSTSDQDSWSMIWEQMLTTTTRAVQEELREQKLSPQETNNQSSINLIIDPYAKLASQKLTAAIKKKYSAIIKATMDEKKGSLVNFSEIEEKTNFQKIHREVHEEYKADQTFQTKIDKLAKKLKTGPLKNNPYSVEHITDYLLYELAIYLVWTSEKRTSYFLYPKFLELIEYARSNKNISQYLRNELTRDHYLEFRQINITTSRKSKKSHQEEERPHSAEHQQRHEEKKSELTRQRSASDSNTAPNSPNTTNFSGSSSGNSTAIRSLSSSTNASTLLNFNLDSIRKTEPNSPESPPSSEHSSPRTPVTMTPSETSIDGSNYLSLSSSITSTRANDASPNRSVNSSLKTTSTTSHSMSTSANASKSNGASKFASSTHLSLRSPGTNTEQRERELEERPSKSQQPNTLFFRQPPTEREELGTKLLLAEKLTELQAAPQQLQSLFEVLLSAPNFTNKQRLNLLTRISTLFSQFKLTLFSTVTTDSNISSDSANATNLSAPSLSQTASLV